MNIPCEICLVRATCRHRRFMEMNVKCRQIWDILYFIRDGGFGITRKKNFDDNIRKIADILNPSQWELAWRQGPNDYHIVVVEGSYEYKEATTADTNDTRQITLQVMSFNTDV